MSTFPAAQPIASHLYQVLKDFEIEYDGLSSATLLRDDLDIDSAELVEIVATVYGGRIPDGKALKYVTTIGELIAFLDGLQ